MRRNPYSVRTVGGDTSERAFLNHQSATPLHTHLHATMIARHVEDTSKNPR